MSFIKLINKNKQTIRTSLFKMGKEKNTIVEIAILPKSETVFFDSVLMTDLAKTQVAKKILQQVEMQDDKKHTAKAGK